MYTHSHTVSTKVLHVSTTHDPMYHSCSHEATQAEKIYHQRKIHWYALHSHLQNMPLHTLVRAELIFYALCILTSRSIFTDADVFPDSYVQSLSEDKGYTDSYICTCMFIYYALLLYTHLYSYMHVLTCTCLCTHTCPVYLGKLLEFPSVTRQHLKTNIKKKEIYQ